MIRVKRVWGIAKPISDELWLGACLENKEPVNGIFKASVHKVTKDFSEVLVRFINGRSYKSVMDKRWEVFKSSASNLEKWA